MRHYKVSLFPRRQRKLEARGKVWVGIIGRCCTEEEEEEEVKEEHEKEEQEEENSGGES